jgi:mycothiol system anti-sigma-R factor
MSCGNPGDVDCTEVLDEVYEYLHQELDEDRTASIHRHLAECGHCLREYGLEEAVRDLVSRACPCSPAPEHLRQSILHRIASIRG